MTVLETATLKDLLSKEALKPKDIKSAVGHMEVNIGLWHKISGWCRSNGQVSDLLLFGNLPFYKNI